MRNGKSTKRRALQRGTHEDELETQERVVKGEGLGNGSYLDIDSESESEPTNADARLLDRVQGGGEATVSGYREGAIMHISLRNFVTYDSIELTPGPNMNMIIGPNGTGKSTIVCAIALGLGEKTVVLGRAKDIGEFVKHGHAQGSVEITLASQQGPVRIRRDIMREGNKSVWRVDGKVVSASEVQRTTRRLQVQVGSLCQFLPQDRVVEFSKLSAQELLRETQVAVGRDDLAALQTELAGWRSQERQLMDSAQRLAQDMAAAKRKNDVLERDVQRWQERQAAESQLRVLTALVPVARYTDAKAAHDRAKEARRQAHAAYQSVRGAAGPATDELETLEASVASSENTRRQLSEQRAGHEREARRLLARFDRLETAQGDLRAEARELKQRSQKRRDAIASMRQEVARLEEDFAATEAPPAEAEPEDARRRMAELRDRKMQSSNEIIQVQDEQKALVASGRRLAQQIAEHNEQLRALDDVEMQRREALRRFHEPSMRALEWVEANRHLFRQHVFRPICLEASVQDTRYAHLIETVVSVSTLRTFVTQCREDYETLTANAIDRMKLRIDVVCTARDLDSFRPRHPRDAIRKLGFDGYALDFIDAPRPVLAAICSRDSIEDTAVALGQVNSDEIEARNLLKEYIADGTRYVITRGRYGARALTVTTSRVKPRAALLGAGDSEETRAARARLTEEIAEWRDREQTNEAAMKKLGLRERRARDTHRQIEAQEEELRQAREQRNELQRAYERKKIHLESRQAHLASLVSEERRDGRSSTLQKQEQERIDAKMAENAAECAEVIEQIAQAAQSIADTLHELTVASLRGVQDAQRLGELRAEVDRHREAVEEARLAFEEASSRFTAAKQRAKDALEETRRLTEDMTDEERQAVRAAQEQRANMTSEELEIELSTCRQRLSMAANSGLSERVMQQHEERKRQLADMVSEQQRVEEELHRVRRRKLRARAQWEEPLAAIIAQVGDNFRTMFDSIECMGEVRLRRTGDGVASRQTAPEQEAPGADDEDYANWGVEIRVAFRKNEALQTLDNHRQSGGERAVSTILYLQALQSLVTAPFRVVDEINQGMDQRNERLVHRLIVDTACRPGSSQYFLITPKLLPDLRYHPLMKVLCIFNGEWQPESFNFNKYIANARQAPQAA
ncbi:Structural maintenance of chromosomes protein 5 [Coemansia sp. Benny D115]|nr:Structural maintenance of chromosomes protein 5 [Coemansia sp. Benny D115]